MEFILETLSECGEAYLWIIICAVALIISKLRGEKSTN